MISTRSIDKAQDDKVDLTPSDINLRFSRFFETKHVREIQIRILALKTFSRGLKGTIRKDPQVRIFENRSISPKLSKPKYENPLIR